jgi:hypothetical protein
MIVVGRQNKIALRIFEGGERRGDLSDVTRWTVWVGTLKIESALNPSVFDWTGHRDDGGDLLVLALGWLELPAGPTTLRACYYTEETPFGVEVENALPMGVRRATSGGLAVPPTLEGVIFDDLLDGTYAKVLASRVLEGKVLVSGLEGTLDDLGDGAEFRRVKAAALTVDGLFLLDAAVGTLDDVADGTAFKRVNASALTAEGLVILSEVYGTIDDLADGTTYKRVKTSSLTAEGLFLWSWVAGEGKPEDGATVGARVGVDLRTALGTPWGART